MTKQIAGRTHNPKLFWQQVGVLWGSVFFCLFFFNWIPWVFENYFQPYDSSLIFVLQSFSIFLFFAITGIYGLIQGYCACGPKGYICEGRKAVFWNSVCVGFYFLMTGLVFLFFHTVAPKA